VEARGGRTDGLVATFHDLELAMHLYEWLLRDQLRQREKRQAGGDEVVAPPGRVLQAEEERHGEAE
jgi:hypothetical protein